MSVVNCDCNNEKNTGEVRIQEYIFQSNAVSFWNDDSDEINVALGWLRNKYVRVTWKVVDIVVLGQL